LDSNDNKCVLHFSTSKKQRKIDSFLDQHDLLLRAVVKLVGWFVGFVTFWGGGFCVVIFVGGCGWFFCF